MQPRREEEAPDMKAPVFDLLPELVQVEEGETAKFMVKVSGNPRPRVTWWLSGTIVVNVSVASSPSSPLSACENACEASWPPTIHRI